jgi:hypothetical protein
MNASFIALTVAATASAMALVAACERPAEPTDPQLDPEPMAETTATPPPPAPASAEAAVADLTGNPAAYEGQIVTVEADIAEVLGPLAFSLDSGTPAMREGDDGDLLVLGRATADLTEVDEQWQEARVRVTGVLHTLPVAEIEREAGWDLDPQIVARIEAQEPVLMATAVERLTGE